MRGRKTGKTPQRIGRIFALLALWPALVGAALPVRPPMEDAAGHATDVRGASIILFWAAWCAPCRAELRDHKALAEAAKPMALLFLSIDADARSRSLLSGLPKDRLRFVPGEVDIFAAIPDMRGALPYAVAFRADGSQCASQRGGISPAQVANWARLCITK
jgi:thiol-disulfide isomerase/thioredoxin